MVEDENIDNKQPVVQPSQPIIEQSSASKSNSWKTASIVLVILLIVMAGLYVLSPPTGFVTGASISEQQAADKAINYIKDNLVPDTVDVSLNNVTQIGNFYQVSIQLTTAQNGEPYSQDVASFISLDGIYFFPSGYNTAEQLPVETTVAQEIPKSAKPVVDLYVMSFCPYGMQAEDAMKPVYDLLKDKVEFNIKFIVNVNGDTLADVDSLHGPVEAAEDARQLCVAKLYPTKLWDYVSGINNNCSSKYRDSSYDACWKAEATNLGMSVSNIESCVDKDAVAMLKLEEADSQANSVSGSPTIFINGVSYSGGRTSEAYKLAICNAFTTAPDECSQILSSSAASGAATASGSC
ncbi:MAG: hypothetical protein ABIG30_00970 [Candidatus Aenigmatarchaeota archaeon]